MQHISFIIKKMSQKVITDINQIQTYLNGNTIYFRQITLIIDELEKSTRSYPEHDAIHLLWYMWLEFKFKAARAQYEHYLMILIAFIAFIFMFSFDGYTFYVSFIIIVCSMIRCYRLMKRDRISEVFNDRYKISDLCDQIKEMHNHEFRPVQKN